MAWETLTVPEESQHEVINVIRAGLESGVTVSSGTYLNLAVWCKSMEEYIERLQEEGDE